jgi:hypothetical protein
VAVNFMLFFTDSLQELEDELNEGDVTEKVHFYSWLKFS